MHGHLNRGIPRRNSLFRLFEELSQKYININKRLAHNYNYMKNETIKKANFANPHEFTQMYLFYETTKNKCNCSENKLEISNFEMDLPCSHRLRIGCKFPKLQSLDMNLQLQYQTLFADPKFVVPDNAENEQLNLFRSLNLPVYYLIKIYSRSFDSFQAQY